MTDTPSPSFPAEPPPALVAACRLALRDCPALVRALDRELGPEAGARAQVARLTDWAACAWTPERIAAGWQALRPAVPSGEAAPAEGAVGAALRILRRRVLCGTLVRDVAALAPVEEVTQAMTALADLAVGEGLRAIGPALAEVHGRPRGPDGTPQDLLVVAMGKGGGHELNVSSDLDLIYVYDEAGETATDDGRLLNGRGERVRPLSNQEFFERLGRRLAALLSEVTAEGFVFRIDLRLRPNGDSGPLAVSCAMLEEYLVRQGREWERFAWLKGRVVEAPVFAGAQAFAAQVASLEAVVRPFVFRRYLDYGAIGALRDLHRKIRAETARRGAARAGLNLAARGADVKLGRGGIREIEFIAQTFQVIRGGREPRLRTRSTLQALATLGALGVLAPETCARLADAYRMLRRIEHALQYVDDAQTHALPADAPALGRIAGLLGLPDAAALQARFQADSDAVAAAFDAVFVDDGPDLDGGAFVDPDPGALERRLGALGFEQPATAAAALRELRTGRRVAQLSESARRGVDRLLQRALAAIGQQRHGSPDTPATADQVLARLLGLVEVVVRRSTYIALLNQHPSALQRVLRVLAAGPFPYDYLRQHPIVLDELLDPRLDLQQPDWVAWSADLEARLVHAADDPERQMNLLRDAHHAQVFRLLLADLDGRIGVEKLADHLSALADVTLSLTLACVWQHLPRKHREAPAFAIVGYGKLGGKELGYASDLDLIYVFDDPDPDAPERYALLVRRLMTWLTTPTSSGVLFDVDLRLRPNGNAGLLVTSFDALQRYQRNEDGLGAWTWEHQALSRARFCCGDAVLGERFEALRSEILRRPRDLERLRDDVLAMRGRMHDGHPNRTALFDAKHDRGGMVDVEFAVQYLVLGWAHRWPALVRNAGNIALLGMAGDFGIVDRAVATAAAAAYRKLRMLQHRLRLSGAEAVRVPRAEVAGEVAAIEALWHAVFGDAVASGPLARPGPAAR